MGDGGIWDEVSRNSGADEPEGMRKDDGSGKARDSIMGS